MVDEVSETCPGDVISLVGWVLDSDDDGTEVAVEINNVGTIDPCVWSSVTVVWKTVPVVPLATVVLDISFKVVSEKESLVDWEIVDAKDTSVAGTEVVVSDICPVVVVGKIDVEWSTRVVEEGYEVGTMVCSSVVWETVSDENESIVVGTEVVNETISLVVTDPESVVSPLMVELDSKVVVEPL